MTAFIQSLISNPMRGLMALEVLALAAALAVMLLRWHARRFPLLALWLLGHGLRQAALAACGSDHALLSMVYQRTNAAAALLELAMVSESVWELRKEAFVYVSDWRMVTFLATFFGFGVYLPILAFPAKKLAPWDMQLLVTLLSVWAAAFIAIALWELRYCFEIDRRVFWTSRLVCGFLLMGVVANQFGVLRWWTASGMLNGLATCAVCCGLVWVFRESGLKSEDQPARELDQLPPPPEPLEGS